MFRFQFGISAVILCGQSYSICNGETGEKNNQGFSDSLGPGTHHDSHSIGPGTLHDSKDPS